MKRSGGGARLAAGSENRGREAADRVPVKVNVRQLLKHLRAEPAVLQPRLDKQLLDALVILRCLLSAGAGSRHGCLKVFNHVSHALIIGDWRSGCQVMRGITLTQA